MQLRDRRAKGARIHTCGFFRTDSRLAVGQPCHTPPRIEGPPGLRAKRPRIWPRWVSLSLPGPPRCPESIVSHLAHELLSVSATEVPSHDRYSPGDRSKPGLLRRERDRALGSPPDEMTGNLAVNLQSAVPAGYGVNCARKRTWNTTTRAVPWPPSRQTALSRPSWRESCTSLSWRP